MATCKIHFLNRTHYLNYQPTLRLNGPRQMVYLYSGLVLHPSQTKPYIYKAGNDFKKYFDEHFSSCQLTQAGQSARMEQNWAVRLACVSWQLKKCSSKYFLKSFPAIYKYMVWLDFTWMQNQSWIQVHHLSRPIQVQCFWMNLAILSFSSYTWFSTMVLPGLLKQQFTSITMVVPWYYLQMIWQIITKGKYGFSL